MAYFDNASTTFPKHESVYNNTMDIYRKIGVNFSRSSSEKSKDANNIKKDLKKNTFFFDKQTTNKKLNLIFPLYSPKISFFKVSGLFRKNMKQNGINQSISIQSFVSKNKVIFNLSPSVPFVYIF